METPAKLPSTKRFPKIPCLFLNPAPFATMHKLVCFPSHLCTPWVITYLPSQGKFFTILTKPNHLCSSKGTSFEISFSYTATRLKKVQSQVSLWVIFRVQCTPFKGDFSLSFHTMQLQVGHKEVQNFPLQQKTKTTEIFQSKQFNYFQIKIGG